MKKLLLIALLIMGCEEETTAPEAEDCAGVAGGTAVVDCDGVCGGNIKNNSSSHPLICRIF